MRLLVAILCCACVGCAAEQHVTYYTGMPLPVGNTGVCAAAKVEVAGTGPCESLPITNYELVIVPCAGR